MSDKDDYDPWSKPSNNGKKPKAGKTGPRAVNTGGGKRPSNEPDFDEVVRKLKETTGDMFSGNGGDKKGIALLAVIGIALWLALSSVFIVSTGEQAVVLRFGEYDRTVGDGLNFKLPLPFEKSFIRDVEGVREVSVGGTNVERLMVTGDENIVDVKFVVQWKIGELQDFIFNMREAEGSVKSAAESAMREVISDTTIASALGEGEGRTKIAEQTEEIMQTMLDSYGAGILITGVQLKPVDVPVQVIDAQIDVQNAKTEQQKVKNQAEAYRNDIIPRARGEAERMIQEAEGYKQSVIAKSEGEASRFSAVYNEYRKAKDVTRKRIYLETMQEVMQGMDKVIMESDSGALPYLPLPAITKKGDK